MPTSNPGAKAQRTPTTDVHVADDLRGFNALKGGFKQDSLYVLNETLPIVRRAQIAGIYPRRSTCRGMRSSCFSRKSPLPDLEGLDGSGLRSSTDLQRKRKPFLSTASCEHCRLPLVPGSRKKARRREPAGLSFEVGLFAKLHSHSAEICVRLRDGFVGTLLHDCGPVIRPHGRPSSFLGIFGRQQGPDERTRRVS